VGLWSQNETSQFHRSHCFKIKLSWLQVLRRSCFSHFGGDEAPSWKVSTWAFRCVTPWKRDPVPFPSSPSAQEWRCAFFLPGTDCHDKNRQRIDACMRVEKAIGHRHWDSLPQQKTHCHCSIAPPRTAGTLVTALLTGQLLANRAGKGKVVAYALKLEQTASVISCPASVASKDQSSRLDRAIGAVACWLEQRRRSSAQYRSLLRNAPNGEMEVLWNSLESWALPSSAR